MKMNDIEVFTKAWGVFATPYYDVTKIRIGTTIHTTHDFTIDEIRNQHSRIKDIETEKDTLDRYLNVIIEEKNAEIAALKKQQKPRTLHDMDHETTIPLLCKKIEELNTLDRERIRHDTDIEWLKDTAKHLFLDINGIRKEVKALENPAPKENPQHDSVYQRLDTLEKKVKKLEDLHLICIDLGPIYGKIYIPKLGSE